MPLFVYSAADQSGKVSKGKREAADQKALVQALRSEGLLMLESAEKKGAGAFLHFDFGQALARIRPVTLVEKMFFTRNLSVMTAAGLSLTRSLEALADESANPKFKNIIAEINGAIVTGKSFADSLRPYEKIFGRLFISMVEVGETTGKLTLVLKLLANQMKRDRALRKRVLGAMLYPAIIVAALFSVGTLMMIYVVPTLTATIKELGVPLPLTTRLIIAVSEALTGYGTAVLVAVAALAFLGWRLRRSVGGRKWIDRASLRLPLFGSLIRKFNVARFCRAMAYLTASGVPIVRSLEIAADVLGNVLYREKVKAAAAEIQKGKQLHTLLGTDTRLFQPVVIQMIGVGEETGKISEMLLRLAIFFEEEIADVTKNLSTVIEPILMVIIGVVVGFFAVSMLQPIYTSLGNIGL